MAEPYAATDRTGAGGEVDVFHSIARVHDGPRVLRSDAGVTVLRMDDVLAVTKRRDVVSMSPEMAELMKGSSLTPTGRPLIPLMLDGEEHTRYRKLLDPLFAPKQVARIEARTRELCSELVDRFAADGRVDLYTAFCDPLPSQIFLALLGLPLGDLDFLQWFKDGIIRPTDADHGPTSSARMVEYLQAELDRRAALDDPGDDLFGGFMKASVDGHRLTGEDVIDIVYLLVLAGLDTVASSLSCMVEWLARHPEERRMLVDDPELWPTAIEELLRIETPVTTGARFATADFDLGEEHVSAGDHLQISWAAADLDPEAFERATDVDFSRPAIRHVAFASGFHRCLGSHLARMELRVALTTLHERIPDYELDPDDPPGRDNGPIRNVDPLPLVFTPAP
jgi:cytochrome P450